MSFYKKHEYLIFQLLINILGIVGLIYCLITEQYWLLFLSFLLHFPYKIFANNIALHRYFSHNSFKTSVFKHKFLCWISILAGAGSPFLYASAHRHHHKFADTEKDLHGPSKGLFKTVYWDLYSSNTDNVTRFALDIYRDPTASLVHKYYYLIWYSVIILTALIDIKITIYGLLLPHVIYRWHAAIIVNTITHLNLKTNYRTYETKDNSSNNIILGAWAFGEAYHNNHHAKPGEYNFAHNKKEYDLTAWIIKKIFLND
jgi:stearoyl-CoA desaturase (delta-9 desaturase)